MSDNLKLIVRENSYTVNLHIVLFSMGIKIKSLSLSLS